MKFLTVVNENITFEEIIEESNSERDKWLDNLVFELYGRQKNKDLSKKWGRKLFSRILKTAYVHAEIMNSILLINALIQHKDCPIDEILGAFQILLLNKIEQGKKVDIEMPTDLNQLVEICENTKKMNDANILEEQESITPPSKEE